MTGYAVVIEQGETGFGAYAPELPGVGVVGDSIEEVQELIREAIALHLDSLRAHGEPVPAPSAVATTVVTLPAA
ncbi:MAG: type II toxin-antitoxin system HicB family antitoxin [Egibacteraceae bacterium]